MILEESETFRKFPEDKNVVWKVLADKGYTGACKVGVNAHHPEKQHLGLTDEKLLQNEECPLNEFYVKASVAA